MTKLYDPMPAHLWITRDEALTIAKYMQPGRLKGEDWPIVYGFLSRVFEASQPINQPAGWEEMQALARLYGSQGRSCE